MLFRSCLRLGLPCHFIPPPSILHLFFSPLLYVFYPSPQTENALTEVWSRTGNQGKQWNRAEVPLRKLRDFEVIFEGVRSADLGGGASLDDLEFLDCAPSE